MKCECSVMMTDPYINIWKNVKRNTNEVASTHCTVFKDVSEIIVKNFLVKKTMFWMILDVRNVAFFLE